MGGGTNISEPLTPNGISGLGIDESGVFNNTLSACNDTALSTILMSLPWYIEQQFKPKC
jgi:hypothetical protein